MESESGNLALSFALTEETPTNAASHIFNQQQPGIGRLKVVDSLLLINNLGRNIEFRPLIGGNGQPGGIFANTEYENGTEDTEYDLDIHGAVYLDGRILVLNHRGTLIEISSNNFAETGRLHWASDAEFIELIGDRLISTSERSGSYAKLKSKSACGVIISDPVPPAKSASERPTVGQNPFLEEWGITSALSVSSRETVCVGSVNSIGLFKYSCTHGQPQLKEIWSKQQNLRPSWSAFTSDGRFLAVAGFDPSTYVDDFDWNALSGGSVVLFDTESGEPIWQAPITVPVAWGNGGVPFVLCEATNTIAAVDRYATLHSWDLGTGRCLDSVTKPQPHSGSDTTGVASDTSLGIAHAVCVGDVIYCGFNRAGYHLFRYE